MKPTPPLPPPGPDEARFARRIAELSAQLRQSAPPVLAAKTASAFHPLDEARGEFRFPMWEREIALAYPDFAARDTQGEKELPAFLQAMVLYYFVTADGVPLAGSWISFAELPDGRFYNQAFQGYTGAELARTFGEDKAAFENAAVRCGGKPFPVGDLAFRFQALPRIPLLVVYWLGDEDFPTSIKILFDAAASHYLPTDGYAILGSNLTRRLIKAR